MSLTDSNAPAAELRGRWRLVELASKVPGVVVAVVSAVAIGVLVVMGTAWLWITLRPAVESERGFMEMLPLGNDFGGAGLFAESGPLPAFQ